MFIQDARETLQELWKQLYFSDEETYEFTPAWADIFTDASLEAHESEIARLEILLEERKPILSLIDAFTSLLNEEQQLQASTQDASRLLTRGTGKRDPTRLLREEKMRKRIAKRKPIVLGELKDGLEAWEERNGKPFLINGESFYVLYDSELSKAGMKRSAYAAPPQRKPAQPTIPATPSRAPSRMASTSSRAGVMSTPRTAAKQIQKQPSTINLKPKAPGLDRERPISRGPGGRTLSNSSTTSQTPSKSRAAIGRTFSISSTTSEVSPSRGREFTSSSSSSFSRTPSRNMGPPSSNHDERHGPPGMSPSRKPPTTPNMNAPSQFRSRSELGHYPKYGDAAPSSSYLNKSPSRSPHKDADGFAMPMHSRLVPRLAPAGNLSSGIPNRSASSLGSYRNTSPQRPGSQSRLIPAQRSKTVDSSRNLSSATSQPSENGSENWHTVQGGSSSDDEFDDPAYLKWRQEAVKQLEKAPRSSSTKENHDDHPDTVPVHRRTQRISEFNWEKDTF